MAGICRSKERLDQAMYHVSIRVEAWLQLDNVVVVVLTVLDTVTMSCNVLALTGLKCVVFTDIYICTNLTYIEHWLLTK